MKPVGNDWVVMLSTPTTVSARFALALCTPPESLTLKVSTNWLTATVGVPDTTPVTLLRFSPLGSEPPASDQE